MCVIYWVSLATFACLLEQSRNSHYFKNQKKRNKQKPPKEIFSNFAWGFPGHIDAVMSQWKPRAWRGGREGSEQSRAGGAAPCGLSWPWLLGLHPQALLTLQLLGYGRATQPFSQGSWNVFAAPRGSHRAPGSRWSEEGSWAQFPVRAMEACPSIPLIC